MLLDDSFVIINYQRRELSFEHFVKIIQTFALISLGEFLSNIFGNR